MSPWGAVTPGGGAVNMYFANEPKSFAYLFTAAVLPAVAYLVNKSVGAIWTVSQFCTVRERRHWMIAVNIRLLSCVDSLSNSTL